MKYCLLLLCASFVPVALADFGIGLCPPKPQTLREFDQERVRQSEVETEHRTRGLFSVNS